ncbi:carbamate kinase [Mixta tenebrionis]|uniref:Carbamate kinase n=1 Tax=Mixta tenebrionis TaxID=2562439 RepID=A0A506VDS5_9GAMM|nr:MULTISPECIES: carbamate kinase [Mixta]QHM76878.1 Carbamate kinase 1 [Mixta theicola]TPW43718.1 carbamate kinase [Mixta tenebrionis]
MSKRIVLALGGNALGKGLEKQMQAVRTTAQAIADLIEAGHELVITHGNGPQVGMIHQAFEAAAHSSEQYSVLPMSVCVALSQGYIGYDLQNVLRETLLKRGIKKNVVSLITQVRVDEQDPAFKMPDKPIGSFLSEEVARKLIQQNVVVKEDSGRGWRRVIASPEPKEIIEIEAVKSLLDAGQVPVTVGGGGIPVVAEGDHLKGVSAVIDKDRASAVLARDIDADMLVILTAVEKVAVNFNTPQQKWLDRMTPEEARRYIAEGQFAPGSMLPKVEAALAFAESRPGRQALITLLERAGDGINGRTGTIIG